MKFVRLFIVLNLVSLLSSCGSKKDDTMTSGDDLKISADSELFMVRQVVGIGKIEPETQIIQLSTDRNGIVLKVLKNDGDAVRKGDELLILDSENEMLNVELIKARIRTLESQAEFDKNSVIESELKLANKKRTLESSAKLLEEGAETGRNIDDLDTEVKLLEAGLQKNKANLSMTHSKLSELNVELRSAQMELNKRTLTAPFDGMILDMKLTPGSSLSQYSVYAEFAPEGGIIARCEVDEMFSGKIEIGQVASITPVGSQNVLAAGKVIRAAPFLKRKSLFSEQPGDREDRRVREIWILLDDPTGLLFNMQVECVIEL